MSNKAKSLIISSAIFFILVTIVAGGLTFVPSDTMSGAVGPQLRPINASCETAAVCESGYCDIVSPNQPGKCSLQPCIPDHYQWEPGEDCCSGFAYTNNINLVMCGKLP